jgi:hypothetical protein
VAQQLAGALNGAATVLAWNAGFEKSCLGVLSEASPEHAPVLLDARDKTQDLLPVVRDHVYHPDFRGSFSIKGVVPALLPDMAYDDLEVSDGQAASFLLESLLCRPAELSAGDREALRQQLAAYCKHDTDVMVRLLGLLRDVAGEHR